ncbi:hypothetical protein ABW636_02795 [Aquimarina sp. 2201CG1-2-11]|uniref:hypothetical protein n=1 Tax=Aquimarina discodermiae TaxID=3231043 RepID=UPI0034619716
MNKDIIEYRCSIPVNMFTGMEFHDFFLRNLWFTPSSFHGRGITHGVKPFRKKFIDDIKRQKENISFTIWDKNTDQEFSIVVPVNKHTHQGMFFRFDVAKYDKVYSLIEKYVLNKIIVGYAHQYYDRYLQSANNATAYRVKKMEPPRHKLIKNHIGLLENIDISHNPGRIDMVSSMWLTSTWRMWFGKEFYKEVTKEKLKSFSLAHEIKELDNDVLFIELYNDPFGADLPENRKIQQAFRDHIKMEELIKKLK